MSICGLRNKEVALPTFVSPDVQHVSVSWRIEPYHGFFFSMITGVLVFRLILKQIRKNQVILMLSELKWELKISVWLCFTVIKYKSNETSSSYIYLTFSNFAWCLSSLGLVCSIIVSFTFCIRGVVLCSYRGGGMFNNAGKMVKACLNIYGIWAALLLTWGLNLIPLENLIWPLRIAKN